jgi:hypothetical protein
MKEITTYADQYGKYYEVKSYDGSYKKFGSLEEAKNWYTYASKYYMSIDPWEESEEDRIAREAREKAIRRNERIDSILD